MCFLISIRLPLCTGLLYLFSISLLQCGSLIIYDQNKKKIQTFIESMTRMFPMTVIRLRDPATRMMSTISTVVYGLLENRLLVLAA